MDPELDGSLGEVAAVPTDDGLQVTQLECIHRVLEGHPASGESLCEASDAIAELAQLARSRL